jgi:CubicO group peptidase (beta-lactamase class C family)
MRMIERISKPLLFEPGTSWAYGCSTDWAGVLVMRLNDMPLEAYMEKNIWDPLGIKNITFHQELKPEVRRNFVTMTKRGDQKIVAVAMPTDEKVQWTEEKLYDDPVADEFGSVGAIGSATEYMKILHSICANDGKLLMPETIDEMFTPQLGEGSQKAFGDFMGLLSRRELFSSHNPCTNLRHGLAGLLVSNDTETGMKSGTLSWSGLPNLLW